MSTTTEPVIEVIRASREAFQVLGMENRWRNGRNPICSYNWKQYDETGARQKVIPYMIDDFEMGVFYDSPPDHYAYLVGAIVQGVNEVPEGLHLAEFPAMEYMIVTHEWQTTEAKANKQIGRIVGYAHSGAMKFPEGYEGTTENIAFVEYYNYDIPNKKYRFEVWLEIRKNKDSQQ